MNDNIELRSEKVRNVIGNVPRLIVRTGIAVTAFFVALLILAAYTVHYPFTIENDGILEDVRVSSVERLCFASLKTPYKYRHLFFGRRKVCLTFEGMGDVMLEGNADVLTDMQTDTDGNNYFFVVVDIASGDMDRLGLRHGMKVHAVTYILVYYLVNEIAMVSE